MIPRWPDPSPITLSLDPIAETICGVVTLVATQDIGGVRPITGYIDIPTRWLTVCTPQALECYAARKLDHIFRPWLYPDPAIAIRFDPFPRWTRLVASRQVVTVRSLHASS